MSDTVPPVAAPVALPKVVDFKRTWDDDCEQVILLHPVDGPGQPPHIHDGRAVVCKKNADTITIEPLVPDVNENPKRTGHNAKWTYVRTAEKLATGRMAGCTIFRHGAVPTTKGSA